MSGVVCLIDSTMEYEKLGMTELIRRELVSETFV